MWFTGHSNPVTTTTTGVCVHVLSVECCLIPACLLSLQLSQSAGREYTNIKYATQAHNAGLHKMQVPPIPPVFTHARDKAPAK